MDGQLAICDCSNVIILQEYHLIGVFNDGTVNIMISCDILIGVFDDSTVNIMISCDILIDVFNDSTVNIMISCDILLPEKAAI